MGLLAVRPAVLETSKHLEKLLCFTVFPCSALLARSKRWQLFSEQLCCRNSLENVMKKTPRGEPNKSLKTTPLEPRWLPKSTPEASFWPPAAPWPGKRQPEGPRSKTMRTRAAQTAPPGHRQTPPRQPPDPNVRGPGPPGRPRARGIPSICPNKDICTGSDTPWAAGPANFQSNCAVEIAWRT